MIFAIICLLTVGVVMGFISVTMYTQSKRIIQSGVEIVGTALKTEKRVYYPYRRPIIKLCTTFTYNAAGKEYTATHDTIYSYSEGDKLKIMYQMDDPESCMLLEGSAEGILLGAKIAIWISIAFLLAGGFLLARELWF